MSGQHCTAPDCVRWTKETGPEALCPPHRGVKTYQDGVAAGAITSWFPDDLVECELDGKMQYGQVVQVEHVGTEVHLWVAVPGTDKPAMWFGNRCELVRRSPEWIRRSKA